MTDLDINDPRVLAVWAAFKECGWVIASFKQAQVAVQALDELDVPEPSPAPTEPGTMAERLRAVDAKVEHTAHEWASALHERRALFNAAVEEINPDTGNRWTQEEIGEKIGKSRTRVGQIKSGK